MCCFTDYVRLVKYGDSLYRCKELKRAAMVGVFNRGLRPQSRLLVGYQFFWVPAAVWLWCAGFYRGLGALVQPAHAACRP